MKMIRWLALFPLVLVLFSGCAENKKANAVTYKDLEGYWVSGYLLHNTELARELASGHEKKPKVQLLRLKNTVNGFADTSYRIHGDTLFYRIGLKRSYKNDVFVEEEEFYLYRIVFSSKDRLVLTDDVTKEEVTFYNLAVLPAQRDSFKEITLGDNNIIIGDSTKFYGSTGCSFDIFLLLNRPTNVSWQNDLNSIVTRINWKATVFAEESDNLRSKRSVKNPTESGTIELVIPSASVSIQVRTQKHLGIWRFSSPAVSDPALSVLIAELLTFKTYCYSHEILHVVDFH